MNDVSSTTLAAILRLMGSKFWVRATGVVLILVGLQWGAVVCWFFLMLGGLEMLHWAHLGEVLLWLGWMFVGPLLLVGGPILYGVARYRTLASALLLVGSLNLSAEVGYQLVSMLHDFADPLIMKPTYGLYGCALCLAVFADISAVYLFRRRRPRGI